MDNKNDSRLNKESTQGNNGEIVKSAEIEAQDTTAEELKAINKFTIAPLKAEDVFTCKVAICDNEIDRQFEVFPLKSLQQLQKEFIGKTVIKDHERSSSNQVARIYATELVQDGTKTTKSGELYTQLVAKIYMLNNDANKNLIDEIKAGIKKEVSVGCGVNKAICSICGVDNCKHYCVHWSGKEYDGKLCTFSLEEVKDAYELSFVAVPAQKRAGVIKSYGHLLKEYDPTTEDDTGQDESQTSIKTENVDKSKELEIDAKIKSCDSFLFVKNHSKN